jgi:hypothetical protein
VNVIPINIPEFALLRAEIESHRRLCGYYLVKLIDISRLRDSTASEEDVADASFQLLDDHAWPPLEQRPVDQAWSGYRVDLAEARTHAIEALVGGPSIGQLEETISPELASRYFERFDALFEEPKQYYMRLGLGDPAHVFSNGIAILSRARAGTLVVVESD